MAHYNVRDVKAILRVHGIDCHPGSAEGGGRPSEYHAAVEFYTIALSLTGEDALSSENRAFAERKLAEAQAGLDAFQRIGKSALPPHGQAV